MQVLEAAGDVASASLAAVARESGRRRRSRRQQRRPSLIADVKANPAARGYVVSN